MEQHAMEVERGERFTFGANWAAFLKRLTPERVTAAEKSLQRMLRVESLQGKRFLDIGSGSGLSSLAARKLGASVRSFDFDPQSVACTRELRRRYFPGDSNWIVEQASILDSQYLGTLGQYDIVYSWGVLHHTGSMWDGLENASRLVSEGGAIFIAIYNDQGNHSNRWRAIKRLYNKSPRLVRPVYTATVVALWQLRYFLGAIIRGHLREFVRNIATYGERNLRGMSYWHDMVDWVGGYPFEVAKPEEIFRFFRDRGFVLKELSTCGGGLGCNEFVFERQLS